jgi:hypothetical protein
MRTMPHPMMQKSGLRRALSCVRRSTRVGPRTLPVERTSNSVTGRRSRVGSVETEVTDGLYLVVTDRVLHRLLHRDADYGTDVHVRFPVRAVGANSKTRASCVVGRVLTQKDWPADTARPLFENSNTLHRSSSARVRSTPGSFFYLCKHIVNNNADPAATSHGSDSAAGTR